MGVYVSNFNDRLDKTSYVLTYPMRPLVDTRVMNMLQLNNIPSGTPVIVAIVVSIRKIVLYLIKIVLIEAYFRPLFIIPKKMKIKKYMGTKK